MLAEQLILGQKRNTTYKTYIVYRGLIFDLYVLGDDALIS